MKLPQPKQLAIGLFIIACFLLPAFSFAQCMFRPITMSEKITKSEFAVLGKVSEQHSYMDNNGNIYTLNKIDITAWLKNHRANTKDLFVITTGGVVGNKAQITEPALQLRSGQEYFLMLQKDDRVDDDKNFRLSNPSKIQAYVYADAQGALLLSNGKYHDISNSEEFSEEALLQRIYTHTKQTAKKPDGSLFASRNNSVVNSAVLAASISTMSPNPAVAGTINTADFLLITGTGFGTVTGTVSFKNADDGGLTYITPPNTSDYVKWKDDSIVVKIPSNAGTGRIKVNGVVASTVLTINYAHISINSSFSGFASTTRQRFYLRNKNGTGGYTFKYNTTSGFSANTLAKNAFKRAANKWKCNTEINWEPYGTTPKTFANDDVNVVLFDATLPAGVLARATSRFTGGAITGSCDNANTVWYLEEIDIQFQDIPSPGYTWQFGPATPSSTQYDFESVALHELGHAHGLGHRIAAGKVMHYSIPNGVSRRVPAALEITGGIAKMAYSTVATCFNPAGSGTPMTTAACPTFQLTGVADNYATAKDPSINKLKVYPNPVADILYVNAPRNSELRLINTEGHTTKIIMVKAGLNKIYLNNISNGIYYVQGKSGEEKVKIVVMH